MYRKHFAVTQLRFDLELKPDAWLASIPLAEAQARLNPLPKLRAIGLVTGEPGFGKTPVCRTIAEWKELVSNEPFGVDGTRIDEAFGWLKTVEGLRKTRHKVGSIVRTGRTCLGRICPVFAERPIRKLKSPETGF